MADVLQRLAELIDCLDEAQVQKMEAAIAKSKAYQDGVFKQLLNSGRTYGEVSGFMPWLNGPQNEVAARLRQMDSDLNAQIDACNHILDNWFQHGEPVAPHYPHRIAIILRKMKRTDLENEFLRAYGRHFISHRGRTDELIALRIQKALGDVEAERLWKLSTVGEDEEATR